MLKPSTLAQLHNAKLNKSLPHGKWMRDRIAQFLKSERRKGRSAEEWLARANAMMKGAK